jgi:hypothetical protein
VGFHSDDGNLYIGSGTGREFGQKWGKENDVVGCGVCPLSCEIFFTLNGKLVGIGASKVESNNEL